MSGSWDDEQVRVVGGGSMWIAPVGQPLPQGTPGENDGWTLVGRTKLRAVPVEEFEPETYLG